MEYEINSVVVGEVTGIQSYGAFVRLSNGEEGMIHISEISPYFVRNINQFVEIGQQVKVKIIDIVRDKNLYRLSLKQATNRTRQNVRKLNSPSKKRYKIPKDQQDFSVLEAKLPEWIEEGLKEMEK